MMSRFRTRVVTSHVALASLLAAKITSLFTIKTVTSHMTRASEITPNLVMSRDNGVSTLDKEKQIADNKVDLPAVK